MSKLARNSLLSGMGFYSVWVAIYLFDDTSTMDQLIFGAFAAIAFGLGMYWFGKRKQTHNTDDNNHNNLSADNS